MRNVEFRAKELNSDEWRYGYLAEIETDWDYYNGYGLPTEYAKVIVDTNFTTRNTIVIDKNTIGQYTGLRDKSNKKIYEGDIILNPDNIHKEVTWRDGSFKIIDIKFPNSNLCLLEYYYSNCYVVGNIHDNKKLIEQIKDRIDYEQY